MSALRQRLAKRIKHVGGSAILALGLHRVVLRRRAVVLLFHRVGEAYPGDEIGVPEAQFERFCALLARHFPVISLETLAERLRARGEIGGCAVITFDDGYLDNYAAAAPILRKYRLPATFFITTGYIGTDRVPGWDADHGARSPWMSWDHVRALQAQGFSLGAHTVNHVNLGDAESFRAAGAKPFPEHWHVDAGPDEQAREIVESRRTLERETGATVTTFAYPYGRRENLSAGNRQVIAESGFTVNTSAYGGTVTAETPPLDIPRIPVNQWFETPEEFVFELVMGRLS